MAEKKKNRFEKRIQELGSDWIGEQVVRLGNMSEQVATGIPGQYYARQYNGRVIVVVNTIGTAPQFDKRVLVRRSKHQPNIWRIAEVLEDYDAPVDDGLLASHHEQHEENGFDRLALDRKQIKQLSVRAAGVFVVQVFGAAVQTSAGVVFINNTTLDLSASAPASGALYVLIESDEDGVISTLDGTPFAAPNVGTFTDIPTPTAGSIGIAYILLYAGQTAIIDNNIRVILPLSAGGGVGASFDDTEGDPGNVSRSAAADGTSDFAARRDHIHLLDEADLFNDAEGDPGDVSTSAAADGTSDFAARRDHVHLFPGFLELVQDIVASVVASGPHTGIEYSYDDLTGQIETIVDLLSLGAMSDTGWTEDTDTWTRTGNHTFTRAGDFTAIFRKGTKIRYKDGGSYEYGIVGSSSHAGGTTTVNLIPNTDYAMAATTITNPAFSHIENPQAWPDWFNYTPTPSGNNSLTWTSVTINYAKFRATAKTIEYAVQGTGTTGGTTSTQLQFTPPVAIADSNSYPSSAAYLDGGSPPLVGLGAANGATGLLIVRKQDNSNWGLGGGRLIQVHGSYPF